MKNICRVKKCEREIYAKALKLCKAHHCRLHAYGDVLASKPIKIRGKCRKLSK